MPELPGYYNVGTSNGEWYTPRDILDRVRQLSDDGEIGLDPFSCAEAQLNVNSRHYYTIEQDALKQNWPSVDLLFANPPYGRDFLGPMTDRLIKEYHLGTYKQGIVLVNNATETTWFQNILEISSAICVVKRRIKFIAPVNSGIAVTSNTRGQIIFYVGGGKVNKFAELFSHYGPCLIPFKF